MSGSRLRRRLVRKVRRPGLLQRDRPARHLPVGLPVGRRQEDLLPRGHRRPLAHLLALPARRLKEASPLPVGEA